MTSEATRVLMAVDIGNTAIKIHRYESEDSVSRPLSMHSVRQSNEEAIDGELLEQLIPSQSKNVEICWRVSSVNDAMERKFQEFVAAERGSDDYRRLASTDVPITANVEDVRQVGIDRLLAAVGGNALRQPDKPAIVIDVGSAVTVDFVSDDGVFQGGVILPGIAMQARALAESAEKLPVVDLSSDMSPKCVIGNSTKTAIRNGLVIGQIGAVREVITRISQSVEMDLEVFITGGDMNFFDDLIESNVGFVEDLVPLGIALSVAGV